MNHTFHIPVLGLGYSVDTPLKVGKYGISSVVSIVDDQLIERMREYHESKTGIFRPIANTEPDFRAKRITSYLNLLDTLLNLQHEELKAQSFNVDSDIYRYFMLLPDNSPAKQSFQMMLQCSDSEIKIALQDDLRKLIVKGAIDVNIMSKVDKLNLTADGDSMGDQYSDALSALRGFAQSNLESSLILSAGMNPRLYSYLGEFEDFLPSAESGPRKKIILKVSDYRSAFIQAKFLAKKGIWISEFRIESGLNCGGHAFATEGFLLGPILEEFKQNRSELKSELNTLYMHALSDRAILTSWQPDSRITVQGGIGTKDEDQFLKEYYQLDGTGWGSPFLLVPEATNVDDETLTSLSSSGKEDFYISGASPLGIPFNNFRQSTAEAQRLERIERGRPGSPCTKKYLVSNTEFTEQPICTASREYQSLKIKELNSLGLDIENYTAKFKQITEKVCLCQGLTTSSYLKYGLIKPRENKAVTICPGPNTAFFKSIYSLEEMVSHIYGRTDLLQGIKRPHMFLNEVKLYVDYLLEDIKNNAENLNLKKAKQLEKFREELLNGISYYRTRIQDINRAKNEAVVQFKEELEKLGQAIAAIEILSPAN